MVIIIKWLVPLQAQDIPALEKDLQSYKDHNEQLRATIDMKTESERTLNQTQESLYLSIKEKESEKKNMVLKCEELQFKVSSQKKIRVVGIHCPVFWCHYVTTGNFI